MKKKNHPLHGHGYGGANLDNVQIITLKEVDSTNNYLRNLAADEVKNEIVVAVAKNQTAGRGQRGNSWESEAGKNLTFSILIRPTFLEARQQFILSQAIALSIKEVLYDYVRSPHPRIKWPNDIYWKDKKLAGILIENMLEGKYISQCIVGVGLNVNQREFLSSAPNPVSLYQILGAEIDREELLKKILQRIVSGYTALESELPNIQKAFEALYRKQLYRRKGLYPYQDANGVFMAEFDHIAPDGHLFLKDEQGNIRRYAFKEVSYIL